MSEIRSAKDLFELFDEEKKGYIAVKDFIEVTRWVGRETGEDINEILFESFDANVGEKISLQEFIEFFEPLQKIMFGEEERVWLCPLIPRALGI